MLVAPKSGKETRDELTESLQGNGSSGGLGGFIDQVKSQVNSLLGQAEDKADELTDDAKSMYQKEKNKYQYNSNVEDLADATKHGVNKAADAIKVD